MSDLDFLFRRLGAFDFPIDPTEVAAAEAFPVGDPATDRLVDFFKSVINQELGRGTASVAATSWWADARVNTRLATKLPVAETLSAMPDKQLLKQSKYDFPLLAVHRVSSATDQHTLWVDRDTWTWHVLYILGPLTAEEQRRLGASLARVSAALKLAINQGWHPAHESGARQFGEDGCGFSSLSIGTTRVGPADFGEQGEGLIFHALHMELQTTELDDDIATEAPFEGVNGSVGVASPEGLLPDVVQFRSDTVPDPIHPLTGAADPKE